MRRHVTDGAGPRGPRPPETELDTEPDRHPLGSTMHTTERTRRAAALLAPLTALLVALRDAALRSAVRLRADLERRVAVVLAAPQRGASAIEWVLITAVVVIIVGVVAVIIRNLVVENAEQIRVDIPTG